MLGLHGMRPLLLIVLSAGVLLAAGCDGTRHGRDPEPFSDAEVLLDAEPLGRGPIIRGILPI